MCRVAGAEHEMKSTRSARDIVSRHRRATYDYEIDEVFEAGIVLVGTEVKSLREGSATISDGAFVTIENDEAWLIGAYIPEYRYGNRNNHEPRRKRKLLLSRRQIDKVRQRLQVQGFTGVPMQLYFSGGWAKLEFGLGKGKKHYDKRQAERKKIDRRESRQY